MHCRSLVRGLLTLSVGVAFAGEAPSETGTINLITSLTSRDVRYTVAPSHYVVLERSGVRAVVVDNSAIDDDVLPGHRAGYNGVAHLSRSERSENLFVPSYAGLNLEHIHDGTKAVQQPRFEPRQVPMELRLVGRQAVELYQAPTPHWQLESCGRYELLEDGTIQYTFTCIPRAPTFTRGFIGLFWASYIQQPQDLGIHFIGRPREVDRTDPPKWIHALSPAHGVEGSHLPDGLPPPFALAADVPPAFVFAPSRYLYTEPWYYGVSHGMAYVLMFRPRDRVWFAQSPSGGGSDNPAWDFQWFIPDYQVGQTYGFVMRAAYLPWENHEQIERATRANRRTLAMDQARP
jgi:hypothetical protein